MKSKRFEKLARRPVNQETYIKPWSETGLTAMESPLDPSPGLTVVDGKVMEMDGVALEDFDIIDHFIVDHSLDLAQADKAMQTPSLEIARMLADINVSRAAILELVSGCTAAKLVEVVNK